MNILDENVVHEQRKLLRNWRISFKQIGVDFVRKGMKDINEILPLLHSLSHPTFFTRDSDFYSRSFLHKNYCLVFLDVYKDKAAEYIRRFLRHPEFQTRAKRTGHVVRISSSGIHCWRLNLEKEQFYNWH